jgi:3-mercaptopyruvate sulfurtransferase SseA
MKGDSMRLITILTITLLWAMNSFAAQAERPYPVDPQTRWAVGATPTPADDLKKRLENGNMMIIDVRTPAQFEKETLPGAINIPMADLEAQLKKISKETYIVFT